MKKLTEMITIHKVGSEPRAGVLRTCLQWGGIDLPISYAFGLGCGYGFTYKHAQDREVLPTNLPTFYVTGNNCHFIEDFCANMGIGIINDCALRLEDAWQGIINHLRQNKPVLVNVNYRLYLKIIRERFKNHFFPRQYEPKIGGMKLLALSYLPEKKEYVVLDGLQDQPVILGKEAFGKIREAKYDLPEHQWQSLEPPRKFYELEIATRYAIAKTAWKMMNPALDTYGLPALLRFITALKEKSLSKTDLDWLSFFSGYGWNEGFYRRTFGKFLS